jgi:DNA polymerase-3 subunit alpha
MLSSEKELLGFYVSGHPLREFSWVLRTYSLADTNRLDDAEANGPTRVGGLVSQLQKRFTKQTQEAMGTFRLEHLGGTAEVIVFPDCYRDYESRLQENAAVMVCGQLTNDDGIRLKAQELYPLAEVPSVFTSRIGVHLPAATTGDKQLGALRDTLERHPGEIPVVFCLIFPAGEKLFIDTDSTFRVAPSEALVRELEQVVGETGVYVGVLQRPCKRNNHRGRRRQGP